MQLTADQLILIGFVTTVLAQVVKYVAAKQPFIFYL
jgi:hypothetical protein